MGFIAVRNLVLVPLFLMTLFLMIGFLMALNGCSQASSTAEPANVQANGQPANGQPANGQPGAQLDTKETPVTISKITPILLGTDLQACADFWKDFGFEVAISVPFDEKLAFISLQRGPMEIMYQSFAFSEATNPVGIEGVHRSILYLETPSLDDIIPVASKYEIAIAEHTTPHGSREIYVRDPAGNLIGFAQHGA